MDISGTGGYVVAPPSIHVTGHVYEWIGDPDAEIAPLPAWIEEALIPPRRDALSPAIDTELFAKGERNAGLFNLGCAAARAGLSEVEIAAALSAANASRCTPPLDEDEVLDIARSSATYTGGFRAPDPSLERALLDLKLGPFPTVVYIALRTFAKNSRCFPAYETITERVGISRTATINAMPKLEQAELLTIQRGSLGEVNRYTLHDPRAITQSTSPSRKEDR